VNLTDHISHRLRKYIYINIRIIILRFRADILRTQSHRELKMRRNPTVNFSLDYIDSPPNIELFGSAFDICGGEIYGKIFL